jgi:hypothetical protein
MRRLLTTTALIGLLCGPIIEADAAVTPNSQVTCQAPIASTVTFVQGTDVAGTYKTAITGGVNGTKIMGLWVTSNDGSLSHLVTVQFSTSTSAHCSPQSNCTGGAAITIPSNSGFAAATPAINFLSPANWPGLPADASGNQFINMTGNSQTVEATFATALTASTQIALTVIACNY